MRLPRLHPGHYTLTLTAVDGSLDDYTICDWVEEAQVVHVGGRYRTGAAMHPPVSATLLVWKVCVVDACA